MPIHRVFHPEVPTKYFEGTKNDILVYYINNKHYNPKIEEIDVIEITKKDILEQKKLIEEKQMLEGRLLTIQEKLSKIIQ